MADTIPTPRRPEGESNQLDGVFKQFVSAIGKRKWVVVLTFMLVVGVDAFITVSTRPIYRASVAVVIEKTPPRVLSNVSEVVDLGTGGYWAAREYYQTQSAIIKSRDVATRVVERLQLNRDPHFLGLDDAESTLGEAEREAIMRGVDAVLRLQKRVEVDLPRDTMIANISLRDTSPEFARDLVNAIAEAYRDQNLDYKKRAIREAYSELRDIAKELEAKKRASEQALYDFELKSNISENRRKTVDANLDNLNVRLRDVHARRTELGIRLRQMKAYASSDDIFGVGIDSIISDPLMMELKRKQIDISVRLKDESTNFLEKHPKVQSLTQQFDYTKQTARKHIKSLVTAIDNEYQRASSVEKDVLAQLDVARKEEYDVNFKKIEYERLKARLAEDKEFYDKINKRVGEMELTSQVETNNIRVLDPATLPTSPITPNMRLNLTIGVLLGLLLGLTLAFLLDFLDVTVKNREDLEQGIGMTFLGLVPLLGEAGGEDDPVAPEKRDIYIHLRPSSIAAESVRSVRTNLLFMMPERPLTAIVVTSPSPSEGKTTVVVNLGIAIAGSSGRTVIVDTDLRRPRLHRCFGIANDLGVSNYVISNEPVDRFIKATEIPNLDLLPSGPIPPNPADLIHTRRMRALLEELKSKYQTVIFDSPPVGMVSDAAVLAQLVDGVIVVAQAGSSTKESVMNTKRQLDKVNATILGCVLNKTSMERRTYGYYYQYGRRYGYKPYRTETKDSGDDKPVPGAAAT